MFNVCVDSEYLTISIKSKNIRVSGMVRTRLKWGVGGERGVVCCVVSDVESECREREVWCAEREVQSGCSVRCRVSAECRAREVE